MLLGVKPEVWASILLVALFAFHFGIVWATAVDVPVYDEWTAIEAGSPSVELDLQQLNGWHNEHRIVPTRLLTWALYRINGWDIRFNILLNFLLYGVVIAVVVAATRSWTPHQPAWVNIAFVVFLLSPISWENHSWAFESQFHFAILFLLLASVALIREPPHPSVTVAGCAALWAAAFSFSGGLVGALVLVPVIGVARVQAIRKAGESDSVRAYARTAGFMVVLIIPLLLWFVGFPAVGNTIARTLPSSALFWAHWANLVGLGFGFDSPSVVTSLISATAVLLPVAALLASAEQRRNSHVVAAVGLVVAVLAVLAATSFGRASLGVGQAKSSRYAEIAGLLLPLSAVTWSLLLRHRRRGRVIALVALATLAAVGYADNWRFGVYHQVAARREAGLACIEGYYEHGIDLSCPGVSIRPLGAVLDRARELRLNFYTSIERRRMPDFTQLQFSPYGLAAARIYDIEHLPSERGEIIVDRVTHPFLQIDGWSADNVSFRPPTASFVVIISDDGVETVFRTATRERPDVATFFGQPGFRDSGFWVSIPTAALEVGRYRVVVRTIGTSGIEYFEHAIGAPLRIVD